MTTKITRLDCSNNPYVQNHFLLEHVQKVFPETLQTAICNVLEPRNKQLQEKPTLPRVAART